jgi:hypothetical protein
VVRYLVAVFPISHLVLPVARDFFGALDFLRMYVVTEADDPQLSAQCGKCKALIDEPRGLPMEERKPCPECGSKFRMISAGLHVRAEGNVTLEGSVRRGMNETRLAVLGILVTISLGVAALVPESWWARLLAGIGSFAVASLLIAWPRSRHLMMSYVHRITGG